MILNSCLATIANMLMRSLRMSLPEVFREAIAVISTFRGN